LSAAAADDIIETVADLPGVLDHIEARLAAGERTSELAEATMPTGSPARGQRPTSCLEKLA
jgi:hypothetical protein